MRGSAEHHHGGNEGEGGEEDETESVQHHGSKPPVCEDSCSLLVISDLVSHYPQLLENQTQLSLERMVEGNVL